MRPGDVPLQRGRQPQLAPDLLNDIRNALLLENAGLHVAREQPHLRHHLQEVVGDEAVGIVDTLGDGLNDAVEVALPGRQVDLQRDIEAQHGLEVERRFARPDGFDLVMEQLGNRLLAVHGDWKQLVGAKWGR